MRFKGTIWETGNSYVITVPKAYVENGQLQLGKEYGVEVNDASKGFSYR